jgi:hypothetical protein
MGSLVHFATARDYVRSRVTNEFLNYQVRVERVTRPLYDETNLVAIPGTRATIYQGPGRIWEITGASTVVVSENDMLMENTQLSLPWDLDSLPQRYDEVVVIEVPPQDSTLLGKRFQIQTAAKAGELRPTRRYTITAVQSQG